MKNKALNNVAEEQVFSPALIDFKLYINLNLIII